MKYALSLLLAILIVLSLIYYKYYYVNEKFDDIETVVLNELTQTGLMPDTNPIEQPCLSGVCPFNITFKTAKL
jgi:hypothetical protein